MDNNQKEALFGQKLTELKSLAAQNGNTVSQHEVEELFSELDLSLSQMDMVYDYIKKQGIKLNSDDKDGPPLLTGDSLAMEVFLNSYIKNIGDIARLYEGQGLFRDDLIGEGHLAVYEAAAPLKGPGNEEEKKALESYMTTRVMMAMETAIGKDISQKDVEMKVLSRVEKVGKAAAELSDTLRRKVSVEELLREEEGFTPEEIRRAIELSGGTLDVN